MSLFYLQWNQHIHGNAQPQQENLGGDALRPTLWQLVLIRVPSSLFGVPTYCLGVGVHHDLLETLHS